ncbi:phage holin family protein [Patescibacteria group bacterium]|nr:phage holin family protein [Patescibacteria group bacterium]MBU4023187.1 phage holin family protein [Patescibacteria group bacterium]MBU4078482.1 phage holin family protein [Patescibacteria group bacterium]
MISFFFQILAGIFGVYLAAEFLPNVVFIGTRQTLLLIGLVFGIMNYLIKPIINFFLTPLRLLTFGLIGLVINIGIVWLMSNIIFPNNLKITNFSSLLYATLIIWLTSFFFYALARRNWQRRRHHYE